ncbi:MAG: hypothetical protein ISR98_00665 [Parcubacteria group bacterium]|nr:hypothetical protein [Parcubacteria group bacterium]
MLEENKTQNTPEPEIQTEAENQLVATASPEIENKTEIPTEAIPETEEKVETMPEIEIQTKEETLIQPPVQEITPPLVETPKEEVETAPQPQEPQIQPEPVPQLQPTPQTQTVEKIIYKSDPNIIINLLNKARAKIQERKRNKLNKVMTLFETKSQITNQDVQKLLRTTKRTTRRYFDQLEKEQKITQVGKVGRSVLYIKKP